MKNALVNGKDFFGKIYEGKDFENLQNAYKPFSLDKNQNNEPIFKV